MASSRIVGTNENISTYGGGGRDYTVLGTWESATDNDLVTLQVSEVLECYADSVSYDDEMSMGGATTDTSYFRIIRPAGTIGTGSWEGHDGTPSGGGVFFDVTIDNEFIDMSEANSSIQDLLIRMTNATTNNRMTIIADGGGSSVIGVLAYDCTNADGTHRGIRNEDGYTVNTMVLRCDQWGIQSNGGTAYIYNCNCIDNTTDGFLHSGGTSVCKNCLATGNDTGGGDDFNPGTYTGSTNNSSGDATAPGTSPRINQTFTFVDDSNDDYHLDPTDAGAHTFGADLSADGAFAFDDDIDGDTRS